MANSLTVARFKSMEWSRGLSGSCELTIDSKERPFLFVMTEEQLRAVKACFDKIPQVFEDGYYGARSDED